MWFSIQVAKGCEAQALACLAPVAKAAGVQELCVPSAEVRVKCDGAWVAASQPLFAGCVVAQAPSAREVRRAVRRARGLDELLRGSGCAGTSAQVGAQVRAGAGAPAGGDPVVVPLDSARVQLLDELTEPGRRTVGFSEGFVDRGRVVVESGPLRGREQLIRRVSHRRKRAYVAVVAGGRAGAGTDWASDANAGFHAESGALVGLSVVRKSA